MSAPLLRRALLGSAFTLGNAIVVAAPALAQASPSAYTSATRYDALGRVTGAIAPDADGVSPWQFLSVRNTYDNWGQLTKVETGVLAAWKSESVAPSSWGADFTVHTTVDRTYDNMGHKLTERVKGTDGVVSSLTQFKYYPSGDVECTAVRMNPAVFASPPASACDLGSEGSNGPDRITRNEYFQPGVIKKIIKGYGTPLQQDYATYTHSASLKVISMTDARGFKAKMSYDGHDRQKRWYFPDRTLAATASTTDYEEYGYDANGNRTFLRKRDGSTLTYSYDAMDRMTVKVVPSRTDLTAGQTRDVYYDYDLRGLMTKARFDSLSGDGVTSGYNGFGELTSSQISMAGTTRTLNYAYDKHGKRIELTHAAGGPDPQQKFTYKRDHLGRLTNIYEGTTQSSTYQLIAATYDNRGLVDTVQRSNSGSGFLADFTFDPVGRLASVVNDAAGTSNDLTIDGPINSAIGYNAASQIVGQRRSNDTYSWAGVVTVDHSYTTNGINQYTVSSSALGTANYCHDANGNLTADSTSVYLYDIENRLVEKRAQVAWACPVTNYSGTSQASLTYDPMGRLWQVTGPTTNTRFLYDGDELVAEYDSLGTMARRHVHSDSADDPVVQYDGAAVGASARTFLMPDERGSIAGLFYNDGTSRAKNTYDEFGMPATTTPGEKVTGRFSYTGQAWIPELGMYHYKARIYSPTLGRFLQTDPIGYDDQVNLYAYVGNDPINSTDPSGMLGERTSNPLGCGSGQSREFDGPRAENSCGGIVDPKTDTGIAKMGIREGRAAIEESAEQSWNENREAGGLVYVDDGEIARTPTEWGTRCTNNAEDRCSVQVSNQLTNVPEGAKILYVWHTHGSYPEGQSWLNNRFSNQDHLSLKDWQGRFGVLGFLLGNPQGQIKLLRMPFGPAEMIGRYSRPWWEKRRKR